VFYFVQFDIFYNYILFPKSYFSIVGNHVTITFTHMDIDPAEFSISSIFNENICDWDYIQLFEGEGTDGPSLGKWCNNKSPPPITSTGSSLTLHLMSHYEFVGYFGATYSSLNTGMSNEHICKRPKASERCVILFPFLSLRRKLHVRVRNDYLAELSEQLSPERGMRLDSEYLTWQQAHSRVHRVRYRVERKLRSGLPRDTGGQRNRKTH